LILWYKLKKEQLFIPNKEADLRNVFDNVEEPLFYDHVHVNDQGNEMTADEIFELTLPAVLEEIKN